jgi:hypothetical protein
MLELVFSATAGSVDVERITISHIGTGAESDVISVKLYLDNGDGSYNQVTDTLIGSGVFSSGTVTFGSAGVSMFTVAPGFDKRVYVVCDFSGTATGTHGVRVSDASSITTLNGGSPSATYPISSTQTSFVPELGSQAIVVAASTIIALLVVLRRKRCITPLRPP